MVRVKLMHRPMLGHNSRAEIIVQLCPWLVCVNIQLQAAYNERLTWLISKVKCLPLTKQQPKFIGCIYRLRYLHRNIMQCIACSKSNHRSLFFDKIPLSCGTDLDSKDSPEATYWWGDKYSRHSAYNSMQNPYTYVRAGMRIDSHFNQSNLKD